MVASEGPACVDTKADPQKRGCFCGMVSKKNWILWSNDILYISFLMIFLVWKSIFQCSTSSVLDCNLTVYSLYLIRCFGRSFLLSIRGTISSKSSWVTGHYTMPPCYAMFLYFFDLILHAPKFSNKKTLETKACPSCKKAAPPLASNMLHWMMVSGQEKIQGMKLKLGTSGSLDLPCVYDASHPTKLLAARKFYVIQVIYMVG